MGHNQGFVWIISWFLMISLEGEHYYDLHFSCEEIYEETMDVK